MHRTLDIDIERQRSDVGYRNPDIGTWILDIGIQMSNVISDIRYLLDLYMVS